MIRPVPPEGMPGGLVERLQGAVLAAARRGLTARRFLDFEGPLGPGITSIEVGGVRERDFVTDPVVTRLVAQRTLPVPMLHARFRIAVREVLGARDQNLPLNLRPAEQAGLSAALAEETLIYVGDEGSGLRGLTTASGAPAVALGDWSQVGAAVQDVIAAADVLDAARAREPFALVLAPMLYNALFRKYEDSDVLQIDNVRRLCPGGVYKSLALRAGGVLVSPDVGVLVCAQDLETRYLLPADASLVFEVSEAIVLRVDDPRAVCRLGVTSLGAGSS